MSSPKLSRKENELLDFLKANRGKVVSYVTLGVELWGETNEGFAVMLARELCSRLRRKIGQEKIRTVRGQGYIFEG